MVLGPKQNPLPITDMKPKDERDNPLILNGFDEAWEFYCWLYKEKDFSNSHPATIVLLETVVHYGAGNPDDNDPSGYIEMMAIKDYILENYPKLVEALQTIRDFTHHG